MSPAWILCALGLLAGTGIGALALAAPQRALRMLGVRVEGGRGGEGETRAIGGLLVFIHALPAFVALFAAAEVMGVRRGTVSQFSGMILIAPVALAWFGAGLGRMLSIFADGTDRVLNWRLTFLDLVLAFMIAMPWTTTLVR
ncbi:MAG: hypothetical protein GC206_05565 [Alphaproteobacteria bacterium]|nr:hypothetical protein [Alphaproteobacteria bacterium]